MLIKLFYGRPENQNIEAIIDQYPDGCINSIQTSILPLLDYWKKTELVIQKLMAEMSLEAINPKICFEYPTPSYKNNRASMTDIMVEDKQYKIAIEAKYREVEQKAQTVSDWFSPKTENRQKVLEHWIKCINPFLITPLEIESIFNIPYQFLHRVASACYSNDGVAVVLYQLFYDDKIKGKMEKYKETISDSICLFTTTKNLRFYTHEIKVELLKTNVKYQNALQYIKSSSLYSFHDENICRSA